MIAYEVTQIYFGKFAEIDNVENSFESDNYGHENKTPDGWKPGTVFTGSDLSFMQITQIDPVEDPNHLVPDERRLDTENPLEPAIYEYRDENGVLIRAEVDALFQWDVKITGADGEIYNVHLDFVQLTNGAIFTNTETPRLGTTKVASIELIRYGFPSVSSDGGRTIKTNEVKIVCFSAGTLIQTANGERAIEDLSVGDMVLTMDAGYQPIRWIGSRELAALDLIRFPNLRPIRVRAGALGDGYPTQDLMVSPQHRMLVRGKIPQRMFGKDEILVAAKHLLELAGIEVAEDAIDVNYFHIMFDRHQIIWANGAAAESLHTGPEALKSMPAEQVHEIFAIFPQLRDLDPQSIRANEQFAPARQFINGRQGRKMAERMARNAHRAYLEVSD